MTAYTTAYSLLRRNSQCRIIEKSNYYHHHHYKQRHRFDRPKRQLRMNPSKTTGKQPMAVDIDDMPETPQHRGIHHRRAHSDTSFRFDDFLLFDPSDLDLSALDLPSPNPTPPRGVPMALDSSEDSSSNSHGQKQQKQSQNPPKPKPINHLRSLSVDSDFFDSLGLISPASGGGAGNSAAGAGGGGEKRSYHRHSNSMDGFEVESILGDGVKKAVDRDRLAELALIDPKRAKRFAFSSTFSLLR